MIYLKVKIQKSDFNRQLTNIKCPCFHRQKAGKEKDEIILLRWFQCHLPSYNTGLFEFPKIHGDDTGMIGASDKAKNYVLLCQRF